MKTLKTMYTSVAEVGTGHTVPERKAKTLYVIQNY